MIQITDDMAIKADKRSFILCFKRSRKGEDGWAPKFYYSEPEHVFDKLIKLAVADGINDGSWESVAKYIEDTRRVIHDLLKPVLRKSWAGEPMLLGEGMVEVPPAA